MILHGKEIALLAYKGDRVARYVMASYQVYFDRRNSHDRKVAQDAERNWRQWLDEYMVRDLIISTRAELKEKYDHHADDGLIKGMH